MPCDVQESQRELPILIERIRHQPIQRVPVDAARRHVIHQPRQIVCQRQRRGGSANDKRRLRRVARLQLFGPCGDQLRQQQAAVNSLQRGRRIERGEVGAGGGLREFEFVLVDVAERHDTRQQHGVGAQNIEKDFPRHAPGAPGRQIERRLRQPLRMRTRVEAIDQPAIDQRGDDRAQKWRRCWNVENAHGCPDSRVRRYHAMGVFGVRFLIRDVPRTRACTPLIARRGALQSGSIVISK